MYRHHLAVVTLAVLSTACTIVVQAEPDDESESTSTTVAASSSSSTGELEDSSSTGQEIGSSTGEVEVDGETSTGDDTTGELVDDTSSGESTDSGETSTGESSTTGETDDETGVGPLSLSLGETCLLDSDCQSGNCIGGGFNDTPRCSVSCSPGSATDCFDLGSPGLCTWGGGDAHWCTGVFSDLTADDMFLGSPPYQQSQLLAPGARDVFLVPPQPMGFVIETSPGVLFDVFDSDGAALTAGVSGQVMVDPQGIHHFNWVVVYPETPQETIYQFWLKDQ